MYKMSSEEQAEADARQKQWYLEDIQKEQSLRTEIINLRGDMLSLFKEYVENVKEEEKMGVVFKQEKKKRKNLINAAGKKKKNEYHEKRDQYLDKYVEYDGYWRGKVKRGMALKDVIGPRITLGLINIIQIQESGTEKSNKTTWKMKKTAEKEIKKGTEMCKNFGCGEMLESTTWKQPHYRHIEGGILIEHSPTQPKHWDTPDSWKYPTEELPELDEELAKELVKDLNYKERVADGIHVGPERGGRKRTRRKKRRRRRKSTKKKRRRKRRRTKKKRRRRRR